MNYKPLVTAALLTLTACSGSATSSPSTDATVTTTITQTTTPTSTIPPTTTTTTSSTTTVPATTAPPLTVDLTHPAETDTATWTLIINALYARLARLQADPANVDPSVYAEPGSGEFQEISSSRQRLIDQGLHFEGRAPNTVESIQSVTIMPNGVATVSFTRAENDDLGQLVNADGSVVDGATMPSSNVLSMVLAPTDDPELPWRVQQVLR